MNTAISKLLIFIYFLLSCNFLFSQKIKLPIELIEVSGLYAAGKDSLWWLNDSGNTADLFLTNRRGTLLNRVGVPSTENRDWESLAADRDGHIYIGDFGNNRNNRKDLRIYRFNLSTQQVDTISFSYPDQQLFPPSKEQANFNMEGFFWYRDSLHLFSKNRVGRGGKYTKHYSLPDTPGHYEAVLRDSFLLKKRVVTGAAIHPTEGTIVLLTYNFRRFLGFIPLTPADIYIFRNYEGTNFFNGISGRQKAARSLWPTQYEAIDFTPDGRLLIATERTILKRQSARYLKLKK
jgi:hypothetical protein